MPKPKSDLVNLKEKNLQNSEDSNIYEVEDIIDAKLFKGRKYYLVKWKHYGPEWNTWEPFENLLEALDYVYNIEQKLKKQNETTIKNIPKSKSSCKKQSQNIQAINSNNKKSKSNLMVPSVPGVNNFTGMKSPIKYNSKAEYNSQPTSKRCPTNNLPINSRNTNTYSYTNNRNSNRKKAEQARLQSNTPLNLQKSMIQEFPTEIQNAIQAMEDSKNTIMNYFDASKLKSLTNSTKSSARRPWRQQQLNNSNTRTSRNNNIINTNINKNPSLDSNEEIRSNAINTLSPTEKIEISKKASSGGTSKINIHNISNKNQKINKNSTSKEETILISPSYINSNNHLEFNEANFLVENYLNPANSAVSKNNLANQNDLSQYDEHNLNIQSNRDSANHITAINTENISKNKVEILPIPVTYNDISISGAANVSNSLEFLNPINFNSADIEINREKAANLHIEESNTPYFLRKKRSNNTYSQYNNYFENEDKDKTTNKSSSKSSKSKSKQMQIQSNDFTSNTVNIPVVENPSLNNILEAKQNRNISLGNSEGEANTAKNNNNNFNFVFIQSIINNNFFKNLTNLLLLFRLSACGRTYMLSIDLSLYNLLI